MEKFKKPALLYGIIGFLLGLCVILFMGAGTAPVGKYQMTTLVVEKGETFDKSEYIISILDTQTGVAKVGGAVLFTEEVVHTFDDDFIKKGRIMFDYNKMGGPND